RERAADRARRTFAECKEAVAGGVDLLAAEAGELAANDAVVALDQLGPRSVAEPTCALGRADEVGEQDGREHAFGDRRRLAPREELLDRVEDLVRLHVRDVILAVELDEPCTRKPLGDVAALLEAAELGRA